MNDEMKEYDLPGADDESVNELPEPELPSTSEQPLLVLDPVEPAPVNETVPELDATAEQKPPSKFKQTIHQISIWLLAILGFALVLYLVLFFAVYRPMKQSYQSLEEMNVEMEDQLSEYRIDLEQLSTDYEAMVTDRNQLLDENELYRAYVDFLNLKNDMLLLQKAYLEGDLDAATLAKGKANNDLEAFVPTLEVLNEPMVDVLRTNLALLTTLESDMDANVDEVETIYTFLLEMEDDLFGTLD